MAPFEKALYRRFEATSNKLISMFNKVSFDALYKENDLWLALIFFDFQMCSSPEVSDKKLYPTFARTFAIDTKLTPSLLSLLNYFKWKRVAIIYENVTKWIEMKDTIVKRLEEKQITIALQEMMSPSAVFRPQNHSTMYKNILKKIKAEARSKL